MPTSEASEQENGLELLLYSSSGALFFVIALVLVLIVLFQRRLHRQHQQTFRAVIDAIEDERRRIGKDLHDDVSLMISGAQIHVDNPKAEQLLKEVAEAVRMAAHRLMPSALEKLGLLAALSDLSYQLSKEASLVIEVKSSDPLSDLSITATTHIYRIISELINNAIRHGKATHIQVTLYSDHSNLYLEVDDNGIGLDITKLNMTKGIGLQSVRSRVTFLKGKYHIQSDLGKGTKVYIIFARNEILAK